jgi:hypothetical protein
LKSGVTISFQEISGQFPIQRFQGVVLCSLNCSSAGDTPVSRRGPSTTKAGTITGSEYVGDRCATKTIH